jgi:predicted RNA-binding Zn ribbon-like protein
MVVADDTISIMVADRLALDLAVTLRHDGHGGVTDDLADPAALDAWLREHAPELAAVSRARDPAVLAAVLAVRTAVRALFARAVLPGPPSRADADRLPDARTALARLNAAAAHVPVAPRLDWPDGGPARMHCAAIGTPADADLIAAALARAAVRFLAGPDRDRLRACPAPRCVRYFVQDHPRQQWCGPACGNRARVARHHARKTARKAPPG